MRALVFGVVGVALLLGGMAAGVGGVGLMLADPCEPSYRLVIQPAEAVENPPSETRSFASLSDYQQTAVEAALSNQTRLTFQRQDALEELEAVTLVVNDQRYVVTDLVRDPCRDLYEEVALVGFTSAIIGGVLAGGAVVSWRAP